MSSNCSTPSVTFLRHLSISPARNRRRVSTIDSPLGGPTSRKPEELPRGVRNSTPQGSYLVASAYLPWRFALVLLQSCIEKAFKSKGSSKQVLPASSINPLQWGLVHFWILNDLGAWQSRDIIGGKIKAARSRTTSSVRSRLVRARLATLLEPVIRGEWSCWTAEPYCAGMEGGEPDASKRESVRLPKSSRPAARVSLAVCLWLLVIGYRGYDTLFTNCTELLHSMYISLKVAPSSV